MTRYFSASMFLFFIALGGLFHVKHFDYQAFSRNFWGQTEFAVFHQGRKGVIIGENGWLFTAEEFSCPQNLDKNFDYIDSVKNGFEKRRIKLIIVLIPEKARVLKRDLPACRKNIYSEALSRYKNISTDLLPLMNENDFLKTDTHWTPNGARVAAGEVEKIAHGIKLPHAKFVTATGPDAARAGDLTRYVPGVAMTDRFKTFTTEQQNANLLGNAPVPHVVLVGTSYSAMRQWNFDGFLKQALQADVLNMSDEGQGPFSVMKKYLDSAAFKAAPPRLVVWEIPERYLPQ